MSIRSSSGNRSRAWPASSPIVPPDPGDTCSSIADVVEYPLRPRQSRRRGRARDHLPRRPPHHAVARQRVACTSVKQHADLRYDVLCMYGTITLMAWTPKEAESQPCMHCFCRKPLSNQLIRNCYSWRNLSVWPHLLIAFIVSVLGTAPDLTAFSTLPRIPFKIYHDSNNL